MQPYGSIHIAFMVGGVLLGWLILRRLRRPSARLNRRILLGLSIVMAVLELYKLLFHYFVIDNRQINIGLISFQFCSLPMYTCAMIALLRPGQFRADLANFTATYNLLGGVSAVLSPAGLIWPHLTMTIHSFTWHWLIIFAGAYLIVSGQALQPTARFLGSTKIFLTTVLIAMVLNFVFKDWGYINMFFISPFYDSSIVFYSQFMEQHGWWAAIILYLTVLILVSYAIYKYLYRKTRRVRTVVRRLTK